jgi:hypothetical protein
MGVGEQACEKKIEKYNENKHVMGNILKNFVINLESSDLDSDTNQEDEDENGVDGILPLSSDSD